MARMKRTRKTLTRTQADRKYARKRLNRAVLVGSGCNGFQYCPQTCGEIENGTGVMLYTPILTHASMANALYQDSIRIASLRIRLEYQPFLPSQEGCDLTAVFARQAHWRCRAMLVKQSYDRFEPVIAPGVQGVDVVNPFNDQDWCEVNALHRWENRQAPYTGYSQYASEDSFQSGGSTITGTIESCCSTQSGYFIIAGEAAVPPITCQPCGSNNVDLVIGQSQTGGTTGSACEVRTDPATRPFTFSLNYRKPIVLRDNDILGIWMAYGGEGYAFPDPCDPTEPDLESLPMGIRGRSFVQGMLEY